MHKLIIDRPTDAVESTLARLSNTLLDVQALTGRPMWIYKAYKEHMLLSGIHELEQLVENAIAQNRLRITQLLAAYRSEAANLETV